MQGWRNLLRAAISAIAIVCLSSCELLAETIESALARAYRENPQLNAQRALVRSQDENVPQALSGYRPRIAVTATTGEQYNNLLEVTPVPGQGNVFTRLVGPQTPFTYGVSASQILFNGLQTANRTRTAESQVQAGRAGLRVMEQNILLNAAIVYMDVLRDSGSVEIQRSYVESLKQLLAQTKKRFSVGDITATDVSQAQAQLAAAGSALLAAEAALATSTARYQEIIGIAPQNQRPGTPVDQHVPGNLVAATEVAMAQNPNITAAMYGVDVAYLQVKISEGALFPTLGVTATVQQSTEPAAGVSSQFTAAVLAQLSVPIYQGGGEYALIRQSKENLGQQRLNLDFIRRQTHTSVAQTWAQVVAAKGELQKAKEQVSASEAALSGMLKEIRVGERTTLDLLIVEQNLINARTALITAQHDRVVASYALLAATGRLSPTELRLPTEIYDPGVHYQQIRDAWVGVRTPDGR
jgi:outer membrane protein